MADDDDDEGRGWGIGTMMRHMMGMDMDDMSERIEGRLAFLKTELKITEAQTPPGTSSQRLCAPPPRRMAR